MRKRSQINFIVAVTMVVISACGVQTDEPASATIEKRDIPGIMNFSRLDESAGYAGSPVGFGGATQPAAMSALKNEGYATVVNLRLSSERGAGVEAGRAAAEAAGLNYIHLPYNPKQLTPALVDAFVAELGNAENQPVYIHCGSATRVAALWMIGRVQVDGLDPDVAAAESRIIAAKPDTAVSLAEEYLAAIRE